MPIRHIVEQGDTIVALAERHGLFARTLWDHPQNAALRDLRTRMDVLLPGDEVYIPDRRDKVVAVPTGERRVFRRRGVPAKFRLALRQGGKPRVGVAWRLRVEGVETSGRTGDDGLIEQHVAARATSGELFLDGGDAPIILQFGHMDPISSLSGVRKRLRNLGIAAPAHDELDQLDWRDTLVTLQQRAGIDVTAMLDDATRDALVELHDRHRARSTR